MELPRIYTGAKYQDRTYNEKNRREKEKERKK